MPRASSREFKDGRRVPTVGPGFPVAPASQLTGCSEPALPLPPHKGQATRLPVDSLPHSPHISSQPSTRPALLLSRSTPPPGRDLGRLHDLAGGPIQDASLWGTRRGQGGGKEEEPGPVNLVQLKGTELLRASSPAPMPSSGSRFVRMFAALAGL